MKTAYKVAVKKHMVSMKNKCMHGLSEEST